MKKGVRKQGICLVCNISYYKYKKKMKYCSRKCFSEKRKVELNFEYKEKLKKRIIEKSKIDEKTGCWIWLKYKDKLGRGYCHYKNTNIQASRVSFIAFKSDIPNKICVCHKCDNYSCVNPDHLFLGTPKENCQDRDRKNRGIKGEIVKISKLKNADILEIKKLRIQKMSQQEIAEKYSVSQTTISRILSKKIWKHI